MHSHTRREVLIGPASGDAAELHGLIAIERLIVFAYEHILGAASLSPPGATALRVFLGHERDHVRLLSDALERRGGAPPPPPAGLEAAARRLSELRVPGSLPAARSEDDALRYLIGVETLAEGAYYASSARLSDAGLLVLAAEAMGCEAQHWTALSGLLHAGDVYRAVPYPVVLG